MKISVPYLAAPFTEGAVLNYCAPRSIAERTLGSFLTTPEIQEGPFATQLQRLGPGRSLYLAGDGSVADVRENAQGLLEVQHFRGRPQWLWDTLQARIPEVRLGTSLPRFWLACESAPLSTTSLYAVLDLYHMNVLERDIRRPAVEARVERANRLGGQYIAELNEERAQDLGLSRSSM